MFCLSKEDIKNKTMHIMKMILKNFSSVLTEKNPLKLLGQYYEYITLTKEYFLEI